MNHSNAKDDFDEKIGFWIQDTMYIYIQNSKNIFNSARLYLVDSQFFKLKQIVEYMFFDINGRMTKLNDHEDSNFPLSIMSPINPCLRNLDWSKSNEADKYRKLFKKYFSVWSSSNIEGFIDVLLINANGNYENYPEVSIRCYDSISNKIKIIYTISFSEGGKYKIESVGDIQTSRCLSSPLSIKRNINDEHPIILNIGTIEDLAIDLKISNITFFNISNTTKIFDTSGGKINLSEYHMKGRRDTMEDKSLICKFENTDIYMFAVLDGHGGQFAPNYFYYDIPKRLYKYIKSGNPLTEDDIKDAFLKSDRNTWYTKRKNQSGTCFSGVLITKDKIYVINLGDSRTCVYYRSKFNSFTTQSHIKFSRDNFITKDHKPSDFDEMKRILDNKGYVMFGRVKGDLAVSRALGDYDLKSVGIIPENTKSDVYLEEYSNIVSPIPDVKILNREKNMHIIIHCDGLNENNIDELNLQIEYQKAFSNPQLNKSKVLCEYVYDEGSEDNLSAITLHLE